ncbi:phage holin family protein [Periweissella fabaria]|uniref:Phage holin family protein n=1 Tax=Periweissella fabaria TaxID=546157 RepID=A0ABM8Z5A6_9LACO|nr:phage holin family protein [Periweissella fabaria]MCM0596795.1 phage holin family protein [Periweissella fabaria]CAH0416532.1 hypothetical protein WFA24289_00836 [Periweissella fabaria]
MTFLQRVIINAISFVALAGLLQSTQIFYVSSIWAALGAAIVLAFLNAFVKPFLIVISLPITIMTLGLFSIINAFLLELTAYLVGTPHFHFASFGATILMAIIMSVINAIVSNYFNREN